MEGRIQNVIEGLVIALLFALFGWVIARFVKLVTGKTIGGRKYYSIAVVLGFLAPHALAPVLEDLETSQVRTEEAEIENTVKGDAVNMMRFSLVIPGIAAYCYKSIVTDQKLIEHASAWSKRNELYMQHLVRVVTVEGGLTEAHKKSIDQQAFRIVKEQVDKSEDKQGYCIRYVDKVASGSLDLDKNEHTKLILKKVMDYSTGNP